MSSLLLALLLSIPVKIDGTSSAALHSPSDGKGPFPAVLLVEGWWTPGTWEQATAQRLAGDGSLVLVVHPDRGERPADRDAMHAKMTGAPDSRTLSGLRNALAWFVARDDVRGQRVAIVGARMGGRDALYLAADPGVAAVVSWYGVPPTAPLGNAPAIAFFGGQDMGPSLADAERFQAAAKGTPTQVVVYPEAQHGFADPKNPWGGYDEKAAADSWAKAEALLRTLR
jgi:dienelactone hydrolase